VNLATLLIILLLPVFLLCAVLYRLRPHAPWEQVANFPLNAGRKPGPGEAAAKGLLEQLEEARRPRAP
jgi:hypothetical protein